MLIANSLTTYSASKSLLPGLVLIHSVTFWVSTNSYQSPLVWSGHGTDQGTASQTLEQTKRILWAPEGPGQSFLWLRKSLSELKLPVACSHCSPTAWLHEQQAPTPRCDFPTLSFPPHTAATACFSSPRSSRSSFQSQPCESMEKSNLSFPLDPLGSSSWRNVTQTESPGENLEKYLMHLPCSWNPP